tara:strand:+ start:2753 stop:3499 length:747 start_codon:yes stop_codon:yes gene_type:complete
MNHHLVNKNNLRIAILVFFVALVIFSVFAFDLNVIREFFYDVIVSINTNRFFNSILLILLFSLRSVSIIIPVLPGTIFSVAAGFQFGFTQGLIIIFIADFLSCSISFLLARNLGRNFIRRLLGARQMGKVESLGKNYLEKNYFLMTALLMSQFFDFVCYAIGLTKITWKRFMPALIFSILISDAPFVASGFAAREIKDMGLKNFLDKIFDGELDMISGNYLFLFIISFVIIFTLAIINIYLDKRSKII